MTIAILTFLAPIALIAASVLAFRGPEFRPARTLRIAEMVALGALGVALFSALLLILNGPATSLLIGIGGLGLSFVGWVVLRFAATYMDGEASAGQFHRLALRDARGRVMLLVIAGNTLQLALAWIATSVFLHKLLLFYPERVAAQRAARKKWVVARAGDAALIVGRRDPARPVRHRRHRHDPEFGRLRRQPCPARPGSPACSRWPRSSNRRSSRSMAG
jgi:NAD(P)H-quinone oxidoreductase subunit 5